MTRLLLLAIFLIGFSSCKSKKSMQTISTMEAMMKSASEVDSAVFTQAEIAKEVEEVETTETTQQNFIPLDSAGFTIFKPVILTTKISKSVKTSDSTKNEQEIKVDSNRTTEQSDSSSTTKDLDKASESEQVIGQALDAIFPKWGKILASVLMALIPVLWGWWKKRNQAK